MQVDEYAKLHAFENDYWWYVAQRRNLIDALADLHLPPDAWVLDAGCGTGRNLVEMVRVLGVEGFGVDVSPHATRFWNGDPHVHRCLGSLNDLPYPDATFDAVCSVDVLGCREVTVERSLMEASRVLKANGFLILLVPAYQWLLSRHDAAVHSVHRFTRRQLRAPVEAAGLQVVRLTHCFPLFFPMIAFSRLWAKLDQRMNGAESRSDLSVLPSWTNRALSAVARAEHAVVRRLSVPFGTTILMVARKGDA